MYNKKVSFNINNKEIVVLMNNELKYDYENLAKYLKEINLDTPFQFEEVLYYGDNGSIESEDYFELIHQSTKDNTITFIAEDSSFYNFTK